MLPPTTAALLSGSRFPQVQLIENSSNVGFARANNLGAARAKGGYLLFLNPDALVFGKAIEQAVCHLDRLDDAGVVGCKLLNADLSVQTSAILRFPTILNQVFAVEFLRLRFPRLGLWGTAPLFSYTEQPQEVEAISGACMFVKRKAFEAAGGFDTHYFMYSEDVDLCRTIWKQGYKVYYTGDAEVVHHGGKSTVHSKIRNFNILMMKESTYAFLTKWRGRRYAGLYKAAFSVAATARLLLLSLLLPAAFIAGNGRAVLWSIAKWKNVLAWSVGSHGATESIGRFRYNVT